MCNFLIDELWGNSKIGTLRGNSKIGVYSNDVTYKLNNNAIAIVRTGFHPKIVVANSNILIEVKQ